MRQWCNCWRTNRKKNTKKAVAQNLPTALVPELSILYNGFIFICVNSWIVLKNNWCSIHDHITSVLRDELHWLSVPQRVIYKLCLITYKAINGTASNYIAAMCVPSSTNQARLRLPSSDSRQLPRTKTELGKRAFAYARPRAWNDFPIALRTSTTLTRVKSALKTHLFRCCYPTCWT